LVVENVEAKKPKEEAEKKATAAYYYYSYFPGLALNEARLRGGRTW
jgi:hypothetical protein